LAELPECPSQRKPQQSASPDRSHDDRSQATLLHLLGFRHADPFQLQRIVADEERRRAHELVTLVMLDFEHELTITLQQGRKTGPERDGAPAPVLASVSLAFLQKMRMQAEARVDEKDALVQRADLDRLDARCKQRSRRIADVERDRVRSAQIVEGAL